VSDDLCIVTRPYPYTIDNRADPRECFNCHKTPLQYLINSDEWFCPHCKRSYQCGVNGFPAYPQAAGG
jgi:hypothetical protein